MLDFRTYFKNPFDTPRISDDNLRTFAEDHVQRIKANNSAGIYTTMLEVTQPLVIAFGSSIDAENIRHGVKKGKTWQVTQTIKQFKQTVSRREGAVRDAFGEGAAEYLSFFPNGLKEFAHAKKSNVQTLMYRMASNTALHADKLGAAIVAEFADLKATYEQSRNTQLRAFGNVENLRTTTATAREALEAQLCVNLLVIASKNVGHPDRLNNFMDQSIIRPTISKSKGGKS